MVKLDRENVRKALENELGNSMSFFRKSSAISGDQASADAETLKDLNMLIQQGLSILDDLKPLRLHQVINLTAGKNRYELPSYALAVVSHDWGREQLKTFKPWQPQYPKNIPSARLEETDDATQLVLSPSPSWSLINALSNFMPVNLTAQWRIEDSAENGNVHEKFLPKVLQACQAAAMKHIMVSRAGDPIKVQAAKNLNPSAVYDRMIMDLERWARK